MTNTTQSKQSKFKLGEITATPGAYELFSNTGTSLLYYINMHAEGDWGLMDEWDKQQNDMALTNGSRILSCYEVEGSKFWIITEADRSVPTVLLPEEY